MIFNFQIPISNLQYFLCNQQLKIVTWKCITLCSLLVPLTSCNIFETRATKPPNETRSHYFIPTTDSLVIENLKYAIEERNTDNYIKCFSDTSFSGMPFAFIPSQEALLLHPTIFSDWDITSEKYYFDKLRISTQENSVSTLILTQPQRSVSSDSVHFTSPYTLSFIHNKNFSRVARGYLEMLLVLNRTKGIWSIQRWNDFKLQQDSSLTWSDWKALFSQ